MGYSLCMKRTLLAPGGAEEEYGNALQWQPTTAAPTHTRRLEAQADMRPARGLSVGRLLYETRAVARMPMKYGR